MTTKVISFKPDRYEYHYNIKAAVMEHAFIHYDVIYYTISFSLAKT